MDLRETEGICHEWGDVCFTAFLWGDREKFTRCARSVLVQSIFAAPWQEFGQFEVVQRLQKGGRREDQRLFSSSSVAAWQRKQKKPVWRFTVSAELVLASIFFISFSEVHLCSTAAFPELELSAVLLPKSNTFSVHVLFFF